jgi:hypothetical protein
MKIRKNFADCPLVGANGTKRGKPRWHTESMLTTPGAPSTPHIVSGSGRNSNARDKPNPTTAMVSEISSQWKNQSE